MLLIYDTRVKGRDQIKGKSVYEKGFVFWNDISGIVYCGGYVRGGWYIHQQAMMFMRKQVALPVIVIVSVVLIIETVLLITAMMLARNNYACI